MASTVQFINNLSQPAQGNDQGGHSHDHGGGEHGHTHEHLDNPGELQGIITTFVLNLVQENTLKENCQTSPPGTLKSAGLRLESEGNVDSQNH